MSERVVIEAPALKSYAKDILVGIGVRPPDAETVADVLVRSNLAGHDSHGILLLPYYCEQIDRGVIHLDAEITMVTDRGPMVVFDGGLGFGQVAGRRAVELAVQRGREHGLACILGRNVNHLGRLGEYTSALAGEGLAAIFLVNCQGSGQMLAPFGGAERRLTNNPISFAAPGLGHSVLLDMALSQVAEAKVWLAQARGERVPDGWIVDSEGQPTNNPDDLYAGGMLLPVGGLAGGHKAYGMIVMVDLLAGILSGGGVCRPDPGEFSNAFLLLAIDVEPLAPKADYDHELNTLSDYVRSARKLPGVDEILMPGDFEARSQRRRTDEGIPIETSTWDALARLAERAGVRPPETTKKPQAGARAGSKGHA